MIACEYGARRIGLPLLCEADVLSVPDELVQNIVVILYETLSDLVDKVFKNGQASTAAGS
jgi:hypothetical protein